MATNMTGSNCFIGSQKSHVSSHHLYYSMCSKCPPPARTQARRRWSHSPTAHFNNRVSQSGPLAVDASFLFVDVRDLGTIDSLLKHTPNGVVNRVEVGLYGKLGSQTASGIRSGVQQRATASLARCDWALSCWKTKNLLPNAARISGYYSICLKTTTLILTPDLSWCMRYTHYEYIHCCKRPNYDLCISQGSVATVLRWGGQNYSHVKFLRDVARQKLLKSANVSRNYSKNNTGTVFFATRCSSSCVIAHCSDSVRFVRCHGDVDSSLTCKALRDMSTVAFCCCSCHQSDVADVVSDEVNDGILDAVVHASELVKMTPPSIYVHDPWPTANIVLTL